MTQSAMITTIKTYLSAKVPPALSLAGLVGVDDFLEYPPDESDAIQIGTYLAEGAAAIATKSESFIVKCNLAGQIRPDQYLSILWPILLDFDPSSIGFIDREAAHITYYPGERGQGSTALIFFEIHFTAPCDDGEIDS